MKYINKHNGKYIQIHNRLSGNSDIPLAYGWYDYIDMIACQSDAELIDMTMVNHCYAVIDGNMLERFFGSFYAPKTRYKSKPIREWDKINRINKKRGNVELKTVLDNDTTEEDIEIYAEAKEIPLHEAKEIHNFIEKLKIAIANPE